MPVLRVKKCVKSSLVWLLLPFILSLMSWNLCFAIHPLITDDAETQGKGNVQLEITGEYSHDHHDGVEEKTAQPETILTYGLLEKVDMILTVPYQYTRTEQGGIMNSEQGLSDLSLDVKWRFYEQDGLALAVKPGMTLPTGNEKKGLGAGEATYGVYFITTKEHDPWTSHVNLGYLRNENKIGEKKDIWHASLATEFEISEGLELVGNIGVETNKDKTSETPPAFLLGGICLHLF